MKTILVPGETLTTEEEFLPGKNTFTDNGLIKSSTLGNGVLDNTTKEASVQGNEIQTIAVGDIIIGLVTNVKENNVLIEIRSVEGGKKVTVSNAQIPIRNISNKFVSRTRDFFRIGDVVRAKVSQIDEYGIDLDTIGKGFGVTKAYCTKCRHEMEYGHGKLMCLNCGSVETRKWFEEEDIREERRPREFDRNRSFGNRDRSRG